MSGFGEKFRTARELRGIDFSKITAETRISARFLRAIENEVFEELPGGLFNRGFVRTYAEAVGLDPDTMVEEYTALIRKAEPQETEAPPPKIRESRERYILPVAAGALVVLTLVLYAGWHGTGSEEIATPPDVATTPRTQPSPAPPTLATPPRTSPLALPEADPTVGAPDDEIPVREEARVADEFPSNEFLGETTDAPVEPRTAVAAAEVAAPTPATGGRADAPAQVAEEPWNEAPVRETPVETATTAAALSSDSQPISVRVELLDRSWVYIELDGEIQYDQININPPFQRNYTVTEALELRIGNPAGAVLSVNGQPVPSPGPSDEVWSLTITPENASSLTGSL